VRRYHIYPVLKEPDFGVEQGILHKRDLNFQASNPQQIRQTFEGVLLEKVLRQHHAFQYFRRNAFSRACSILYRRQISGTQQRADDKTKAVFRSIYESG
jgi:hypothetical protein